MGETRVDLFHLLEDLRDAYVGPLEETILTETTANALDSGASHVAFTIDTAQASLTVIDNGRGMLRRELARYHDVATSTKRKGEGIGFAGVGIKLGLLACREVVTESRRGSSHVATTWGLSSRHRAPWKWTPPPGLVTDRGTAVRLMVANVLSPLLDPAFVELTLRRHFATLLDPTFLSLLADHGRPAVTLSVHGRALETQTPAAGGGTDEVVAPIEIRLARKRKPSVVGYLVRRRHPFPEDEQGIAISTLGKVIARGWDWLGVTPSAGDHVSGLVEVPALAAALTLNKASFVRTGAGGALYLAYRKALQEAVARHLAAWGDLSPTTGAPPPKPIGLRELEHVLASLAAEFPLLGSLVDRKRGGQKNLPIDHGSEGAESGPLPVADPPPSATPSLIPPPRAGEGRGGEDEPLAPETSLPEPSSAVTPPLDDWTGTGRGRRRAVRFGLRLTFEERPDDPEIARLVESIVTVNTAHPSYKRAQAIRAVGYHIALSVAMALAAVAVEPSQHRAFLASFLAKWGDAVTPRRSARKVRGHRRTTRDRTSAI